ncbi:nucleotidyltransferase domain-containing protein [Psychrobacillus lasiicapitis]|uniref:Nucleotidyltransferase domain-containing protein n=1 Tax=Psychrobacillus lasiicapitis TaxID=1636719 RepID=A0A544ST49_9BACI|nr:nucleotidyltransferase domain-containing protein [Psychrobacillus lasiicapitis]TQR08295.1 nucleotidyltransferase domain-containing protein [Psychrobacillus lasiicapitis]GGA48463.1 nucleotidyltransferase [Psychrobacillus lasiicapitis]
MNPNRLEPVEAAKQFISLYFPDCQGAILAGSVVQGKATETSDLDIVVFSKNIYSSYRESLIVGSWPIEVFVHNLISYKSYFESDRQRARPSLPRMIAEGVILKNEEGILGAIQEEAKQLLASGPELWSDETINIKRYFITDALDDFIGSHNRAEELFVANTLAELTSEFILRTNLRWIGASKWIVRSLKEYDEAFTEQFVEAFDLYYKTGLKNEVIEIVDKVLHPYGGRLFEGFSLGK